jgi:hypothetical protein
MTEPTQTPKAVKPTIFANEERFDPFSQDGSLDPGRIEGYSEIIKANDLDMADDLTFRDIHGKTKDEMWRLIGAKPRKLNFQFAWLPVSGVAGGISQAAAIQLDHYQTREGFQLANEADLSSRGCKLPPTAHIAADGTIRRGADVALYIRSGEVARKWERYRAEQAARAEGKLPDMLRTGDDEAETFRDREERRQVEITS